ncbi:Cysteine desulfurase, mitochondrial, partial [Trichinella pseudospiralis]
LNRINNALSEREIVRSRPLYLDAQATTPTDPRVLDAMIPYSLNLYGNPHSRTHKYGWESETAVETARERIASLIGADAREIIFTSGATEANNLAIKGVAHYNKSTKNHIITTQTEHKCVLDSCRRMELEGFKVTYLPVQKSGLISLESLEKAINDKTVLVSVMTVNNEIGVIQPIEEIGRICRQKEVYFHSDAAQAIGKIPIDVDKLNVDLMSISGHKIYGPKGVGALFIRRRPRVRLEPQMSGGGQEKGFRSGTVPVPLVVGLGTACMICQEEMQFDIEHVTRLSNRLCSKLREALPACTSSSLEPSYVLRAIGTGADVAHSSIRFGIGRFTTEAEVDYTAERCIAESSLGNAPRRNRYKNCRMGKTLKG